MDRRGNLTVKRGQLIALEGIDGAGKTTLGKKLQTRLETNGIATYLTRDTGNTPIGEEIRKIIQTPRGEGEDNLAPWAELFLFVASRAQHYAKHIEPILAKGGWVICDRYIESSMAYQGGGRGVDQNEIRYIHNLTGMQNPDLVLYLDVPPEISFERVHSRISKTNTAKDRMEFEDREFFTRVRNWYRNYCEENPSNCVYIDATLDEKEVEMFAWNELLIQTI